MKERTVISRAGSLVRRGDKVHRRERHAANITKNAPTQGPEKTRGHAGALFSLVNENSVAPEPLTERQVKRYRLLAGLFQKYRFNLKDGTAVMLDIRRRPMRVGPHTSFSNETGHLGNGDYSNLNISESDFKAYEIAYCNFSGAVLDGSSIRHSSGRAYDRTLVLGCAFRGASMKDMSFRGVEFSGQTDMRDTDVTGADFGESKMGTLAKMDLRGSNITSEQFDDLLRGANWRLERNGEGVDRVLHNEFTYDSYTFNEAQEQFGVDEDTLTVLIWSGAVEVRDNTMQTIVSPADFNPADHHIPQWAAAELRNVA